MTDYRFGHSELTMRELFRNPQGRAWFSSASNNKASYTCLAK